MSSTTVIEAVGDLDAIRADWDRLAESAGRPFAAPAWGLAWWEHLRPADARLRVVAVRDDGDRLVGVGPFYASDGSWRLLAAGFSVGVAPLAEEGREREVAGAIAAAIRGATPRPGTVRLEQQDPSVDWPGLLGGALAGGRGSAWGVVDSTLPAPRVDLGEDGFDAWFAAKSSSFRREVRRKQRRLEELGAEFRYATPDTLERDVAEFLRLHRSRREGMGGSSLDGDGIEQALVAAMRELLPSGRMGLLCLDADGRTVAAQVIATAGAETSAWNSGFDEDYAKCSPSMQCIVRCLADLAADGRRTMSLGPGAQEYKSRLADRSDDVSTHVLTVPGRGQLLARGRLQARAAAKAVKQRLLRRSAARD